MYSFREKLLVKYLEFKKPANLATSGRCLSLRKSGRRFGIEPKQRLRPVLLPIARHHLKRIAWLTQARSYLLFSGEKAIVRIRVVKEMGSANIQPTNAFLI